MTGEAVLIAYCPEHGLHGSRSTCFVCEREVEQVPMVPVPSTDSWVVDRGAAALCLAMCAAAGLMVGFALGLLAAL